MDELQIAAIEAIKEADYILVGCGDELSNKKILQNNEYEKMIFMPINKYGIESREELEKLVDNEKYLKWLESVLTKYADNFTIEAHPVYDKLYELIKDKNYFIITTNTDNGIFKSEIDSKKIVAPCGNEALLQCQHSCENKVWDGSNYLNEIIENLDEIMELIKNKQWDSLEQFLPVCPSCNGKAEFNVKDEVTNYMEAGYLEQWQVYLNWLMRTLNKNILMLELGENFKNPTVIRWAFEKNTFINNKAKLVRVNEKFPQITEEIKEKSIGISMNSADFIRNAR